MKFCIVKIHIIIVTEIRDYKYEIKHVVVIKSV